MDDAATEADAEAWDRATVAFQTRDYGASIRLLEPLAQDRPGNSEVQLLLSRSYFHAARLAQAERVLRSIVQRWPDDAYAHLLLARTLQRQGRAQEGRPHLMMAEAMGLTD